MKMKTSKIPGKVAIKGNARFKSGKDYADFIALQKGDTILILFQDSNGSVEYWSTADIIRMYTNGIDSAPSYFGFQFLRDSGLITKKQAAVFEKDREKYFTGVEEHAVKELEAGVQSILEDMTDVNKQVLERLRDQLIKSLGLPKTE